MASISCWSRAAAASLVLAAAPAWAVNCYMVVDRGNHVIYQSEQSPVDLSDAGAAARDAMRARGDQLIAMSANDCQSIDTRHLANGRKPATVDEIVAGMRPALNFGRRGASASAADAGGIRLPSNAPAPTASGRVTTSGLPVGVSIR